MRNEVIKSFDELFDDLFYVIVGMILGAMMGTMFIMIQTNIFDFECIGMFAIIGLLLLFTCTLDSIEWSKKAQWLFSFFRNKCTLYNRQNGHMPNY